MSFQTEFPALYAITKMYPELIRLVGDNLEYYSVDVRIDYERWIQFQEEYGEWARTVYQGHSYSGEQANGRGKEIKKEKYES